MPAAPQPEVDVLCADGPPIEVEVSPPPNDRPRPNESARWRTRIARHLDTDEERAIMAEVSRGT